MKKIAVAFTGKSNSGKTTLIINIANMLKSQNFKVCIVKHDPQDKAIFDKEGKDSDKFTKTNSDVIVVSPTRTTMFKNKTSSIDEIVELFGEFDYLLVEGLKTIPLPRIAVCRDEIDDMYFEMSDAIAINSSIDELSLPIGCFKLELDNVSEIIKWIDENGKKYE
jgi:molybdopterin-guanine dinucleotide biosynthesis adapter protein